MLTHVMNDREPIEHLATHNDIHTDTEHGNGEIVYRDSIVVRVPKIPECTTTWVTAAVCGTAGRAEQTECISGTSVLIHLATHWGASKPSRRLHV